MLRDVVIAGYIVEDFCKTNAFCHSVSQQQLVRVIAAEREDAYQQEMMTY